MNITFKTADNKLGIVTIYGVNIDGVSVQGVTLQTDSATQLYKEVLYTIGSIDLLVSDNAVYSANLYGCSVTISVDNDVIFRGYICQSLQNSGYNYEIERVNIQVCDELTWQKSRKYTYNMQGTIRDVIAHICDIINVSAEVEESYYLNVNDTQVAPIDTYININAMLTEDKDLTITDVLESICRWLNVTAFVYYSGGVGVLRFASWSNKDTCKVSTYDGEWQDTTQDIKECNNNISRADTTVSTIDAYKQASIKCEYKQSENKSSDDSITVVNSEVWETWNTYNFYNGVKPVSYVEADSYKELNMAYYNYYGVDNGNDVTISDKALTEYNIGAYCSYINDETISGNVGAISMYCGAEVVGAYGDDTSQIPSDVDFKNGILLYGVGMVWRANVRDYNIAGIPIYNKPLFSKTYNINQVFSLPKKYHQYCGGIGLIKCSVRLMADIYDGYYAVYKNENKVNGVLPSIPVIVKMYVDAKHTHIVLPDIDGNTIIETQTDEKGTYFNQTTYIRLEELTEATAVYNDDINATTPSLYRLNDAITIHVLHGHNGAFRIPDKTFVERIELIFHTPTYYTDSLAHPEAYVDFAHMWISNLSLDIIDSSTNQNNSVVNTDTEYIWLNESKYITDDEYNETADICSYDGKSGGYNVPMIWGVVDEYNKDGSIISIPSAYVVKSSAVVNAEGETISPEEVRLASIAEQYKQPTMSITATVKGVVDIRTKYIDPISGKTLYCVGCEYDVVNNESIINVVEVI